MPISNQAQATALVTILHTIRATRSNGVADWHPKAIEKTLFENHTHPAPYPDIVVALTKYARDSDKRVPSFMFDALADWHEPGTVAPRNPCGSHPEESAHNCRCCRADYLAGIRTEDQIGKALTMPDTLDTAMSREAK